MNDFDHPPHATTAAQHVGRPPLSEVPLSSTQVYWRVEVPGPGGGAIGSYYTEKVAKIVHVTCKPCSLLYRAYEDDPRPCPGCSRSPVPEFPMRELEAARKVVNVVRDRLAVLGNGVLGGVEKVRALMAALDEYVAACGGPAAAEKIMEQVEKERTR